jgi:hypothetical protein
LKSYPQTSARKHSRAQWRLPISYCYLLVNLLFLANVAAVSFNFGAGAEIPYKVSLTVVFYASLPLILRTLLAALSLVAGMNPES